MRRGDGVDDRVFGLYPRKRSRERWGGLQVDRIRTVNTGDPKSSTQLEDKKLYGKKEIHKF